MKIGIREKDGKPFLSIFTMNPHAPYNEEEHSFEIIQCWKNDWWGENKGYGVRALFGEQNFTDDFDITEEEFNKHESLKKMMEKQTRQKALQLWGETLEESRYSNAQ